MTDERIDYIADLVVKGMPDGIRGFLVSWGWRQFARAILEDCGVREAAPSAAWHKPVAEAAMVAHGALHAVGNEPRPDRPSLEAIWVACDEALAVQGKPQEGER